MEERPTNWLEVLSQLCFGDVFGHESWFVFGLEQHKGFYYCFIGDCSVTEEDGWNVLYGKENKKDKIFVGKHSYIREGAIINALAQAFSSLASLPLYKDIEKRKCSKCGWQLNSLWSFCPYCGKAWGCSSWS